MSSGTVDRMRGKVFNTFGVSIYLIVWLAIGYIHIKSLDGNDDYSDYFAFQDSKLNTIFLIVLASLKCLLCIFFLLIFFWLNFNFINNLGLMFMRFVKIADFASILYLGYYAFWKRELKYLPWIGIKIMDSIIMWLLTSSIKVKEVRTTEVKAE